jgi:hypothetical protein
VKRASKEYLAVRKSSTIHFEKLQRQFEMGCQSDIKFQTHPGMFTQNILENFVINVKPETFSVNKRKKQTSIFRSSKQRKLKPTLIPSLKKIEDTSHLVQAKSSRTKNLDKNGLKPDQVNFNQCKSPARSRLTISCYTWFVKTITSR